MTIEIIKKGIPIEDKRIRFTCQKCNSELEAGQKDGKREYDYRKGYYILFACPVCGNSIYMDAVRWK